jgi:hypothetical protein
MSPGPSVVASIPGWLWVLVSCGVVGAVGACVAAIVGAVMQRNAAQKLEARRAGDAQALERLKADLVP